MFTGIIQDIGTLLRKIPQGNGARLVIATKLPLDEVKLGDSIAVCGACLTVVKKENGQFEAEISRETAARSTLGQARSGERLHLERAMRLSDRLDGHLVLGHVDGVGEVTRREEQGDSLYLELSAPEAVHRYLVEKGSVAVHGVSLTVNEVMAGAFSVTIVPYTRELTTLAELKPGSRVNLEADLIGKYVERLLAGRLPGGAGGAAGGGRAGSDGGPGRESESGSQAGAGRGAGGGLTLEQLARNGFVDR